MGLVERISAAGSGGEAAKGEDARSQAIEEGVRALEDGFPTTSDLRPEVPENRRVRIDFNRLREGGHFTPLRRRTRLGMELRALKRRLLNRIGFFEAPRIGKTNARRLERLALVTSTRPGEGKTFLSLNLALSLAFEDNTPVLLIDADLNRPKIADQLGLSPQLGLSDLLTDESLRISDIVLQAEGAPLFILPAGLASADPPELFGSERAIDLLRLIRREFGDCIVVLDAPPVLAATEAMLIAREVDEVLFVVQANETRAPMLETALEELADVRTKISFVLNFCAINKSASHYGAYYEYSSAQDAQAAGTDGDS